MKLFLLIIGAAFVLGCASQQASYSNLSQGRTIWEDQLITDSIAQDDVTGVWSMTISTRRGNRENELIISLEDEQYKGKTDKDSFDITRNGNQLSWASSIDSPMGSMQAKYSITVKDTEMTGTVQASGRTLNVAGKKK